MGKYSIILPVRNGGEYVKLCVGGILSQTYTDFDLVVLDNCSTDGTLEWLNSLADTRIKILTADRPLTIEESWLRVTRIQKNEFITITGHDDIFYPDFLQTVDQLISDNPSASLYLTHFQLIDDKGKVIRPCKSMEPFYNGPDLLKAILTNSVDIMGTGYVMRAKDYDSIEGIPVKYPSLLYADFELWVNLTNIQCEAVSPATCFAFRMHQSTAHSSHDHRMHKAMEMFINYLSMLKQSNKEMRAVIDEYGSEFLLFHCRGLSHRLLRSDLSQRGGMTVSELVNETKVWARKLGLDGVYHPDKIFYIGLAKFIDRYSIMRNLFLLMKKVYPKAMIKK